jgi:hypothetical protein
MPFILLYSNIYLNFHPTFFSLRAKFRLGNYNIQELEANYFRLEKRLAKVAKIRRVALKQEGANYSR